MNTFSDKIRKEKTQSVANSISQRKSNSESSFQFVDKIPEAVAQMKLQKMANDSPQVSQLKTFENKTNNSPGSKQIIQLQANPVDQSSNGGGEVMQMMFSRFARPLARGIGGSLLASGLNEGVRRGVDHFAGDNSAGQQNQEGSFSNAARHVAERHNRSEAPSHTSTGQSLVESSISNLNRLTSSNTFAEGIMEGPYSRSNFLHLLGDAPERVPQALHRGADAIRNGIDFATADRETQMNDVVGAGIDTIRDMDPLNALGTIARTGADLANSEQRENLLRTGNQMVSDTGSRLGFQFGSGMLLSAGLRAIPVIGPAASIANTALTVGGALTSAGNTAESSGSLVRHIEERTAARRQQTEE